MTTFTAKNSRVVRTLQLMIVPGVADETPGDGAARGKTKKQYFRVSALVALCSVCTTDDCTQCCR